MDRDTIKTLLMTTSVVAIIAGSAQEANATVVCASTAVFTTPQASVTQTTNVACILIESTTVTGDVTVNPGVTIGPNGLAAEITIFDSSIGGGFFNNGTVLGTVAGGGALEINAGLVIEGGSTVGNGVTNGATGVFSIQAISTAISGTAQADAVGVEITQSSFAGNLVNNGIVDVTAFADPPGTAIATATGMAIVSTSFVGNVINTNSIAVAATAIAGGTGATTASATARARGVLIGAGNIIIVVSNSGGSALTQSHVALVQSGTVSNSGVINAQSTASALAGGAGTGLAAATALSDGIVLAGQDVTGSFTNTGSGSIAFALTDTFIGNITNTDTILSSATAFAAKSTVTGPVPAQAEARAFGIRLVGDQFTGDLTSGGTSLSFVSSTLGAAFTANITNTDFIGANAVAKATAFATTGTATATVDARAVGIDVVGVNDNATVSQTSLGNITNLLDATFTGNISNSGAIFAGATAFGTAASADVAAATVTGSAAGISVIGAQFTGNVSNLGTGNIINTLNVAFLGNISNSGFIDVAGTSVGTATSTGGSGAASAIVHGNADGISVIGGIFNGNVTATASGSITDTLTDVFTGNITNSATGLILASSTAFGLATSSGGGALATVHSSAGGIRLIGGVFSGTRTGNVSTSESVIFSGNIINDGGIFAGATAFGQANFVGGASGLANIEVDARARGIAVLGAVFTSSVSAVGSFTGNVTNTGTVAAFATAVGSVTGTAIGGSTVLVDASADGIQVAVQRFSGNITSTGSIAALGSAEVDVGTPIGNTTALAFANGIYAEADTLTGNVTNAGLINVFATATNNDQTALAVAGANGMLLDVGIFGGNVSNTGAIFVQANANATNIGSFGFASAHGIALTGGEGIGTISNGAGAVIFVGAIAQADSVAQDNASGIVVAVSSFNGTITNDGVIVAFATATAGSATGLAAADAAGIHVGAPAFLGTFASSFVGNITNTGLLDVVATAAAAVTAAASAGGIVVANSFGTFASDGVVTFSGNISNTGTISVFANALAGTTALAHAGGIIAEASQMTGNVDNGGTILAVALATATNSNTTLFSVGNAVASGIEISGGTNLPSDVYRMSSFSGNVTNTSSGSITAQAIATNLSGAEGLASAHAAGILIAGGGLGDPIFFGVSNLTAEVTNQGFIGAGATAVGGVSAIAAAFGIEALFSTFTGNVANGGTIIAQANASASSLFGTSLAFAEAQGIGLGGADLGIFLVPGSIASGNVSNTGFVTANANATSSFGTITFAFAGAAGINVSASTFTGDVSNSATGIIQANASATSSGPIFAFGSAFANGVVVSADTFIGNISNAGTVTANATATGSGAGFAGAAASGISIFADTFLGNVTNTGFIGASARASQVSAFGSAIARDSAYGIAIFDTIAIGTIANSGTLVQVSTFVGNIKNAGTIMAFSSANAAATGSTALGSFVLAIDPATGILIAASTFTGAVNNNGLIVTGANATASGSGTSITAIALSAGIGVNVPGFFLSTDVFLRTSTFTGTITNAGTILTDANASTTTSGPFGTVVAGATGIRAFAQTFVGDISNSGFIQATATASNNVQAFGSILSDSGTVFAAGIHVGGVTSFGFDNHALISTFIGNISNTGTILAFATGTNILGAYAAGIQIDTFSGMTGNVSNSATGVIVAGAVANASSVANASASGIFLQGFSFVGNVSNDGTIIAQAIATGGPFAGAAGQGISDRMSTFIGNITNTGQIAASASAFASGILADASAFATGINAASLSRFIGNISNTGTISAFATALANAGFGRQDVHAIGIDVVSVSFIGDILNTAPGIIAATASAPTVGSTSFGGATGISVDVATFLGNVSNTGTVTATGTGVNVAAIGVRINGDTFLGNINNDGAGVISAKSSSFAVGVLVDITTFAGNINNNALIIASGDATGIYSTTPTFLGAINNTGTIIGTGGAADRGIRVTGGSIAGGINNSGTIQGGFASIDLDAEQGTDLSGTTITNESHGLLKGNVFLSAWADTLHVLGGSTVFGNISGNMTNTTGSGGFGNNDFVNFDLGKGGFTTYQFKITNVNTVDLSSGTLILDDQDIVGTVTLGPGNIDPVNTFSHSSGATLGLVVDVGHITTLGPSTPPTVQTITVTSGIGSVSANTVFIGAGAVFKAFEEPDFYANKNVYPDVVVGLTSMFGNYAETNVLSNSPLLDAFMVENGSSSGGPGQDTLVLTRRAFNKPLGVGLTPNENAAGTGLEGLYKTGNSTALAIIPPLFGLNGPQYAAALKLLDGETILERPDLWQTVMDSILHRLTEGEGFNGVGVAGAMLNHGPIQVASAGQSDGGGLLAQTNISPMGVVRPWSVWLRGYGVFANGPATINATSFDENREGAIGGIDYHVTDNLLVGGVFNYAHGEVNLDAPTPAKNKQDAYQFAAYGKYQQGPWYVNAIAGGGFTSNKETRQQTAPLPPATLNGSYNGETFAVYGEAGWNLYPMPNLTVSPLVGVGYNWLRYDGFVETGAPSSLHVNAATTSNLYTALGARAQTAFNIGTAAPLVPELRVVWQHEFLDANQEMNASFGGGTLFNVQGSKFSRESVIAGIGVSNNVSPDLKLFLDYDAKIQGGYSAHAVSAGVKWAFGGAAPPPPLAAPPPLPPAQPAAPPPAQAQVFVVYFDFDRSTLTPEAVGIIRQATDTFKRTGAVTIRIDGYTDLAGTQKYNIGLSKRRADAVRAELVKDGVASNAVAEAWHGKTDPAVPTPDGVREPRNRRVTLALP